MRVALAIRPTSSRSNRDARTFELINQNDTTGLCSMNPFSDDDCCELRSEDLRTCSRDCRRRPPWIFAVTALTLGLSSCDSGNTLIDAPKRPQTATRDLMQRPGRFRTRHRATASSELPICPAFYRSMSMPVSIVLCCCTGGRVSSTPCCSAH